MRSGEWVQRMSDGENSWRKTLWRRTLGENFWRKTSLAHLNLNMRMV